MAIGGNSAYAGLTGLPGLVAAAVALAASQQFDHSCAPEQGQLLSVLARGWSGGRIGETGTGCGVGLAWMTDAVDLSTSLISIELDEGRAAAADDLFTGQEHVTVLQGDWTRLREFGPFDLLVLDGGGKGKDRAVDTPIDPTDGWLKVGGTVVLDDFLPAGQPGAENMRRPGDTGWSTLHCGRRRSASHPAWRRSWLSGASD
jgi:predicted O-methyltransferase YrrM